MNIQGLRDLHFDLDQYINLEEGLGRLRNNAKLYCRLLSSFAADTQIPLLGEQLAAGDIAMAQMTAHSIKGVAANLSLPRVFELSAGMDKALKEGNGNLANELAALKAAVAKTVEYIEIINSGQ